MRQIRCHLWITRCPFPELPIEDCLWMGLLNPQGSAQYFKLARERTTPNLKARKSIPVFWATFSPVRRGLFPVVRDLLCIIPTEQLLYYRNLGLYYGLASGTLPLYSGPCLGVKGGCVSCDKLHLTCICHVVANLELGHGAPLTLIPALHTCCTIFPYKLFPCPTVDA